METGASASVRFRRLEALAAPVIARPASSAPAAIINDGAMSELPVLGNESPAEGTFVGTSGPLTSIDGGPGGCGTGG